MASDKDLDLTVTSRGAFVTVAWNSRRERLMFRIDRRTGEALDARGNQVDSSDARVIQQALNAAGEAPLGKAVWRLHRW
ncbi:hypothetical protein [Amycolatopsis sp. NPDC001319]|uniref:hypothetical protein n=1 Tax=unclassified Amycolatopsis TaxID=2618356 RepID=UPI003690175D